jgi:hypothetical protein
VCTPLPSLAIVSGSERPSAAAGMELVHTVSAASFGISRALKRVTHSGFELR